MARRHVNTRRKLIAELRSFYSAARSEKDAYETRHAAELNRHRVIVAAATALAEYWQAQPGELADTVATIDPGLAERINAVETAVLFGETT